jgi:hypothetical protein
LFPFTHFLEEEEEEEEEIFGGERAKDYVFDTGCMYVRD